MLPEQSPTFLNTVYSYIPLITPAVTISTCSPDRELLQVRIALLGTATIATFGASLALGIALFPPALVVSVVVVPAFYIILIQDLMLAETAANNEAVIEYIKRDSPSPHSIRRIIRSVACALQLIKNTKDISKISKDKTRILDPIHLKKEIFELFVDAGVDILIEDEHRIPLIVDFDDPSFLEYALKKDPMLPSRLTPKQQIRCFQHVRNLNSIAILKNAGFDINVCITNGFTPLFKCILYADEVTENSNRAGISYYDIIRALLNQGADPHMGIIYRGKQYNAIQFNKNPEIAQILAEYM